MELIVSRNKALETLRGWMERDLRYSYFSWENHVQVENFKVGGNPRDGFRVRLYTDRNVYTIVFREADPGDPHTYFGCQVSSRKPLAGENWTRGNDLPDGKFSEETWRKMVGAIASYELVPLANQKITRVAEAN